MRLFDSICFVLQGQSRCLLPPSQHGDKASIYSQRKREQRRVESGLREGRTWVQGVGRWTVGPWCANTQQGNDSSQGEPDHGDSAPSQQLCVWHHNCKQKQRPSGQVPQVISEVLPVPRFVHKGTILIQERKVATPSQLNLLELPLLAKDSSQKWNVQLFKLWRWLDVSMLNLTFLLVKMKLNSEILQQQSTTSTSQLLCFIKTCYLPLFGLHLKRLSFDFCHQLFTSIIWYWAGRLIPRPLIENSYLLFNPC